MKRRKHFIYLLMASFFMFSVSLTSCKTGEGCNTENYKASTDKDGNFSTKRGKSTLFSKKQKKRKRSKKVKKKETSEEGGDN